MGDISKEVASTVKVAKKYIKNIFKRNDFFIFYIGFGYTYVGVPGIETSGIETFGLIRSGLCYFSLY